MKKKKVAAKPSHSEIQLPSARKLNVEKNTLPGKIDQHGWNTRESPKVCEADLVDMQEGFRNGCRKTSQVANPQVQTFRICINILNFQPQESFT